jgi:cephalosporin-C deacetylase
LEGYLLKTALSKDAIQSYFEAVLADSASIQHGLKRTAFSQYSDDRISVSRTSFQSIGNVKIAGWLVEPEGIPIKGAVIQFPGYSEVLFPQVDLAKQGVIVFSVSVRGHHGSDKQIAPGFPGLFTYGLPNANTFIYRQIIIDVLRGFIELADYTKGKLPIVAMGKSQGAALAILLAALREDVRAVAAEVPWLCAIEESLKITDTFPYREVLGYIQNHPEEEQCVKHTLALFDLCNHALAVKCPVLLGLGISDPITPISCTRMLASKLNNVTTYEYEGAGHEGGGLKHRILQTEWILKQI